MPSTTVSLNCQDDDTVSFDSIRNLATAQSLVSTVCANICNSSTSSSLKQDLAKMKELHAIQASLMNLTYTSMMNELPSESSSIEQTSGQDMSHTIIEQEEIMEREKQSLEVIRQ